MDNRGFTLVELIATIALLTIISIVSFISINEVVKQSKVNDCENIVSNIMSAAKEYASDKRYDMSNNADLHVAGDVLISNDYLTGPVINPFTNEEIAADSIMIDIELNDDYSVKKVIIGAPDILKECKSE